MRRAFIALGVMGAQLIANPLAASLSGPVVPYNLSGGFSVGCVGPIFCECICTSCLNPALSVDGELTGTMRLVLIGSDREGTHYQVLDFDATVNFETGLKMSITGQGTFGTSWTVGGGQSLNLHVNFDPPTPLAPGGFGGLKIAAMHDGVISGSKDVMPPVASPQPWISADLAVNGGSCHDHGMWLFAAPANGDVNADGSVNGVDLGLLLLHWSLPASHCGGKIICPYDLNQDGFVDGIDLGILLSSWSL